MDIVEAIMLGASTVTVIGSILGSAAWLRKALKTMITNEIKVAVDPLECRMEARFDNIESDFDTVFEALQKIQETLTYMNFDLTTVEDKVFQLEHRPTTESVTVIQEKPRSMRERMKPGRRGRQKAHSAA